MLFTPPELTNAEKAQKVWYCPLCKASIITLPVDWFSVVSPCEINFMSIVILFACKTTLNFSEKHVFVRKSNL